MNTFKFDADLALEQYNKRKEKFADKQINNSALPAGSPMYYCRFCGCPTETLPESHMRAPTTKCEPCDALHIHGLI